MRTRLLALVVGVALGLACAGTTTPVVDGDRNVVVVPVVGDPNADHFCCAYTEGDTQRFVLLDTAQICRDQFADRDGRWVEGPDCLPCCCKSRSDASYALVTPSACADHGACVTDDVRACAPTPPRGKRGKRR